MEDLPTEYAVFLKNKNMIELPRKQIFGNCWAIVLASIIGDKLSIKYNLKSIYPSSIWITSMAKEISKFDGALSFDNINVGYNCMTVALYMIKYPEKFYTKVEDCYKENETIIFETGQKIYKPDKNIKIDYLGNKPDCCLRSLRKNNFSYYCKNKNFKDMILNSAKIKVTKLYRFMRFRKDRFDYTHDDIKYIQDMLKYFIMTHNIVVTEMIYTQEYYYYKQKFKYSIECDIFEQKENFDNFKYRMMNHSVVILGWSREKVEPYREFWYIRDSNLKYYRKVAFSRYDNKECWFGLDIHFTHYKYDFGRSFSIDCDMDKVTLNNLIENNIFQNIN